MSRGRSALGAVVLWLVPLTAFAMAVPKLSGRVNDYAELLSPAA